MMIERLPYCSGNMVLRDGDLDWHLRPAILVSAPSATCFCCQVTTILFSVPVTDANCRRFNFLKSDFKLCNSLLLHHPTFPRGATRGDFFNSEHIIDGHEHPERTLAEKRDDHCWSAIASPAVARRMAMTRCRSSGL